MCTSMIETNTKFMSVVQSIVNDVNSLSTCGIEDNIKYAIIFVGKVRIFHIFPTKITAYVIFTFKINKMLTIDVINFEQPGLDRLDRNYNMC